ncbi:MAG: GNAT family N-acetyltransferase [Ignavibacteriae bacterium]|nr:GNAT family N-acetyltransferase [Ignavibacteriota bacterium]
MFEQTNIFLQTEIPKSSFELYVDSLGAQTFRYGNATHAFADILHYMNNRNNASQHTDQVEFPNIIMPSFIPAKLFRIILACGYTPRFYEIDEYCRFDVNEISELVSPGTKAIFAIHYFGHPTKIETLRNLANEKNIYLVEDCAHVIYAGEHGKKLGTWGDFSIFSPRKMLNLPEGGYLVLNRRFENFKPSYTKSVNSLYTLSKLLQTRGKYYYLKLTNGNDILGIAKMPERGFMDYSMIHKSQIKNISRLTSFYSKHVDAKTHIEKRKQNYFYLYNGLKDFSFLKPLYNDLPETWTPYSLPVVVQKGNRGLLQSELINSGISCGAGWPESPFDKRLKKTLALSQNLIELPVHPFTNKNQFEKILEVCEKFEESFIKNSHAVVQAEKKVLNESYTGATDSISRSFNIEGPTTPFHITEQLNKTVNNGTIREIGNKLSHNNIRTVVVKTDKEFDNLYAEWEELCEDADVHIFQTFEWQRLWWKYYGNGKQLNLILFYYAERKNGLQNKFLNEKLIGIAPFFIDQKYIGGIRILSRLRLIGSGVGKNKSEHTISEYSVSDYLDLIVHRGYERKVAETLIGYLKEKCLDYDIIQLDEVRSDSAIFKFMFPLLKDFSEHSITKKEICPRITVPETIDNYFNRLNPRVRYQLKKIRRDITKHSLFNIKEVESAYELEQSYDDFVRLHQKRWNHVGVSGLFSDDKYRLFLKDIAKSFLTKGQLYFTSVYSKDECIAVDCAFKYKKYYYDYLKAFNDQSPLAKYRPGKALLLLLIENAIENKSEVVDLLRGGEPYKFEFTNDWQWVYKVTINNPVFGYSFRHTFFLLILFFVRIKRRTVNEINIMAVQIKNYGLSGLTAHYIPSVIKKIKNKLLPPLPAGWNPGNNAEKFVHTQKNKFNPREKGLHVNNLSKV